MIKRRNYFLLVVLAVAFAAAAQLGAQTAAPGSDVVRVDPALDAIVAPGTHLEKVADDFDFTEGPVWVRKGGYLLFSDIPKNQIDKYDPKTGKVSVYLHPSGFTGTDASNVGMETNNGKANVTLIGSNAVTIDKQGRVVFCAHGDRAIMRIEKDGTRTVLADRYNGKRLNSPNDLVYKSDGALYFTDPPAGLRGNDASPQKEQPVDGVYLLKDGKLTLLDSTFVRPNGLAFLPGQKQLYVNDTTRKLIMKFDVNPDDTLANGKVFIDMNSDKTPGNPDGMKVDTKGNVYCAGPGGFWIMSPDGKHIGTVKTPEGVANMAFGDPDGKTLYVTARTGLYKIRLKVAGIRP